MSTIVERLASFAESAEFDVIPSDAIEESKRVILDSIGCALAATESPKGRIGVDYGVLIGAGGDDSTIIGTAYRASIFGAAFANGELINALDFDAVLPPGHVVPYVLPAAMAMAERENASGRDLLAGIAVAHEMSFRIGRAMDYVRDMKDGQLAHPAVFGYSSSVFGATSAVGRLLGLSAEAQANALGIAASIAPVNSVWSSWQRAQSTTIKGLAGVITQAAFTATHLALSGHRGEIEVLDDREYGYPRFIGSSRWEPDVIVEGLGRDWLFPAHQSYKIYPHCRVPAALLDALETLVERHRIKPSEIEAIRAWGEPQGVLPIWTNREINHLNDAQFSIPHGLAVGVLRLHPRRRWQDPDVVWSPEVLELMDKVTFDRHPDYERVISQNPASRPSRIELVARGTTFVEERTYPRGGPTPDASTYVTTAELAEKFRDNAQGILADDRSALLLDLLLHLDEVDDVSLVLRLAASGPKQD